MELVEYLDTQTVARALLGPGPSGMKDLLRRLNVPKEFQKETADYYGPITPEYIEYCRSDVENTRQIFKGCRDSEASLGKSYLEDLGIKGFNEQNPDFDPVVLGCFMETYYGGRSEVRVRHECVEVDHDDFKSQTQQTTSLWDCKTWLSPSKSASNATPWKRGAFLKLSNSQTCNKIHLKIVLLIGVIF